MPSEYRTHYVVKIIAHYQHDMRSDGTFRKNVLLRALCGGANFSSPECFHPTFIQNASPSLSLSHTQQKHPGIKHKYIPYSRHTHTYTHLFPFPSRPRHTMTFWSTFSELSHRSISSVLRSEEHTS